MILDVDMINKLRLKATWRDWLLKEEDQNQLEKFTCAIWP